MWYAQCRYSSMIPRGRRRQMRENCRFKCVVDRQWDKTAAIAYDLDKMSDSQRNVLLYGLGGETLNVHEG